MPAVPRVNHHPSQLQTQHSGERRLGDRVGLCGQRLPCRRQGRRGCYQGCRRRCRFQSRPGSSGKIYAGCRQRKLRQSRRGQIRRRRTIHFQWRQRSPRTRRRWLKWTRSRFCENYRRAHALNIQTCGQTSGQTRGQSRRACQIRRKLVQGRIRQRLHAAHAPGHRRSRLVLQPQFHHQPIGIRKLRGRERHRRIVRFKVQHHPRDAGLRLRHANLFEQRVAHRHHMHAFFADRRPGPLHIEEQPVGIGQPVRSIFEI